MPIASIILCAGKSTRMKSSTSKVLHTICGTPLCVWTVGLAVSVSKGPVVPVVGFQSQAVESSLLNYFGENIYCAEQAEQKGTGHAVKIALQQLLGFKGIILILCGDTPLLSTSSLIKLCDTIKKSKAKVVLTTTVLSNPAGYGRIIRNNEQQIIGITEEFEATPKQKLINEVNAGIYAFNAQFLQESIEKIKSNNSKNEYYLTDLVALAAKQNSVLSINIPNVEAIGINDRIQLAAAENIMQEKINKHWMEQGVTLIDSKTTYIDKDVKIANDVVLEPSVHLHGKTQISSGVRVGVGSILIDTTVLDNAQIKPYCICENAFIGKDTSVGPFARLREETRLEDGVKIGNFVETKKSVFKKGAKANHLAYIGDAEIGEKTNIGAGTITCNYDGFKKHKTKLGKNVFIGSNSTLIAPLTISDDAFIAAGSTITKDVPAHALAIGRTRQENKKDYSKKIRQKLSR